MIKANPSWAFIAVVVINWEWVWADQPAQKGLIAELTHQSATDWLNLADMGLAVGGWGSAGINYNLDEPVDRSNGPMSMTDRNSEFNLYQLNLFVEKNLSKADGWELGGHLDLMFGTDTRYTQATGHWDSHLISNNQRLYDLAFPQAYLEFFAPIGNGLTAKLGHFYSIIGFESVPSAPNFFSSHTYSFKSSPFTTTGALFSYELNSHWSLNLGAVTGADNFDRDLGAWSHMSGLSWNNQATGTSVVFSVLHGDVYQNQDSELVYYSSYLQQTLGDWKYILQHDRGTQQNTAWYSVVNYLIYQATQHCGVGLRGEWFRDADGVRYTAGPANYYALTAGLNWQVNQWLNLRPEVRYDWSQSKLAPFVDGTRAEQIVLGLDFVVKF